MTPGDVSWLGADAARVDAAGGGDTAREISQQPRVWSELRRQVGAERARVDGFLGPLLADPALRIILTGAGSSAFIGECLAPALTRRLDRRVEAIATTDIVSGPGDRLQPSVPTLLVSFARSGNSPESVAAVDLADRFVGRHHHLVITCNAQGDLQRRCAGRADSCVITLPDEIQDRAFAMTSSFSSMLLAAAIVFGVAPPAARPGTGERAVTRRFLERAAQLAAEFVAARFERVVFLGSNELKGLARESALKLLELSDGRLIAASDSPLGFRHGPKTIVNSATLVVVLMSNDAHARRYDLDLLRELRADGAAGRVVAVSGREDESTAHADCLLLDGTAEASDLELCLPMVVLAQVFGLRQSLALGLRPDTPNAAGTVSRVVRGVTIYPVA